MWPARTPSCGQLMSFASHVIVIAIVLSIDLESPLNFPNLAFQLYTT